MKTLTANPLSRLIFSCAAAFVLLAAWNCEAGLTLQLDLEAGPGTYVCSPNLSTNGIGANGAPTTFHQVSSPTGQFIGDLPANSDDLRNPFSDFNSFIHEMTNGLWTLTLNVGATNQQTYHFAVTNLNITSNTFVPVNVTFPLSGATEVPPLPTYTWTGPSNWDGLFIDVFNIDASVFHFDFPSVTATSDTLPPALPAEHYTFVVDYNLAADNSIGSTTPTNSSGTPISGWVSTAQLDDAAGVGFTVAAPPANSSLVAHYTFDDENNLGADSSVNGYTLDFNGGDQVVPSGYVAAGAGAAFFDGGSYLTYSDPPAAVMNALASDFTLSLWLSTTDSGGSTNDPAYFDEGIVAADIPGQHNDIIPMALTGGGIGFNTGPDDNTINTGVLVNNNMYHHVVVTRRQTTGEKQIYIDGVLCADGFASTNLLNDPKTVGIGTAIDASQTDPALISTGNSFNGFMDDIQLYSTVLTPSQISFLFNNPGSEAPTNGNDFNFALNTTNLTWTVSGDSAWFVETTNTHDNVAAAQTGIVTNNQTSVISTTITGPAKLTYFWENIGMENLDLEFDLDGNYENDIFGFTPWSQDGPYLIPAGSHTLSWTVFADGDDDTTEAAFLDQVSIIPLTLPVITVNPFDQTNYPGYPVVLIAAASADSLGVTWQWFKVGVGAIANATTPFFSPTNSGASSVAGQYYAVASNEAGSVNTTTSTVTFVSAPLPPDWTEAFKSPFQSQDSSQLYQDFYYGVAPDTGGNLYTSAEFGGNVTFGSTNVDSGAGGDAAALVKQSTNGTALWIAAITNNGTGNAAAYCVAPNTDGGAFLAGDYSGSNFLGSTALPFANEGMFLGRFSSGGSNVWLKTLGVTNGGFITQNCLASDPSGNVTLAALFNGPIANIAGSNVVISGQQSVVFQLNAAGTLKWVTVCPGFVNYIIYNGGRIYASFTTIANGSSTNAAIGGMTNATDRAWALAALNDSTGLPVWIRGLGARSGSQNGNPFYRFVTDDVPRLAASGTDVFVTGAAYDSTAVFGAITVPFGALRGQYFARYDTNGNAQAAVAYGSTTTTPTCAIADSGGDVYVCGTFDDSTTFGQFVLGGPVEGAQFNGDLSQAFLVKFDRNGTVYWARMALSPDLVNLYGLALAPNGVWGSGYFSTGPAGLNVATKFGQFNLFSDLQFFSGGAGGGTTFVGHPAGVLAMVTDTAFPNIFLNDLGLSGKNYSFSFISTAGHTNMVQFTTNLDTHIWSPFTNIVGDGTLKTIVVPATTPAEKFFRVSTQ